MADTETLDQLTARIQASLDDKLEPSAEIMRRFAQEIDIIALDSGELLKTLLYWQRENQTSFDQFLNALKQDNDNLYQYLLEMRELHLSTQAAANAASGAVNYEGDWATATGAAAQGHSYSHNGSEWTLLVDLADITASEPSSSNSNWRRVADAERYAEWSTLTGAKSAGLMVDHNGQTWILKQDVEDITIVEPTAANVLAGFWINTVDEIKSVAIANNTSVDSVAFFQTGVSLTAEVLRDTANELTLIAWDTLITPYVITSYTANEYAGYDVVTDRGTLEFVTEDIKKLRDKGFVEGWGANETADSYASISKACEYLFANNLNVRGDSTYQISQGIVIPEYRTEPPAVFDWPTLEFNINGLVFTGGSGNAVECNSPGTRVKIRKLIGPDVSGVNGFVVSGQGDCLHDIGVVRGFEYDIYALNAYSHTINLGYIDNAETGVRIEASNAIKIYAGRIGGQFTESTVETDSTSCNIGIDIVSGTANEIHANVEYCKRTTNSIGFRDAGDATVFVGYLESSNLWNLYSTGEGSEYTLVVGTNKKPSGVFVSGNSEVNWSYQNSEIEVEPSGNNTTLAFDTPSVLLSDGFGVIAGSGGYSEHAQLDSSTLINELVYSNQLSNANWTKSNIGNALWSSVTESFEDGGFTDANYRKFTKYVIPALPASDDIYRISQTGLTLNLGLVHYGAYIFVESGSIDVLTKVLDADNNVLTRNVVSLTASNRWIDVAVKYKKETATTSNATFEMQFRTSTGATIKIANTYLINNETNIEKTPVNSANTKQQCLRGVPINGNAFENGAIFNGALRKQISEQIVTSGVYILDVGDFPVYLVGGGFSGNLFLSDLTDAQQGREIVIKRTSDSASGTVQLVPEGVIDGSSTAIDITSANFTTRLIWDVSEGWLSI